MAYIFTIISKLSFQCNFHSQKQEATSSSYSQFPVTSNLSFASLNLPTVHISCKWSDPTFVMLCLACFLSIRFSRFPCSFLFMLNDNLLWRLHPRVGYQPANELTDCEKYCSVDPQKIARQGRQRTVLSVCLSASLWERKQILERGGCAPSPRI